MVGEPTTALALLEHVVADTTAAGRGVHEPIVADVDADVIDVVLVVREEEEIAGPELAGQRRHALAEAGHPTCAVRQVDPAAAGHLLDAARGVDASPGRRAPRPISCADKLLCRSQKAR